MIKVAICDDEASTLENLKAHIHKSFVEQGYSADISVFNCGKDLLDFMAKNQRGFDVIFLDVEMPELNGFQTAERIKALDTVCLLIFITNMKQYAREGYKYSAFRYIFKSGLEDEIPEAVTAALKELNYIDEKSQPLVFKIKNAGCFESLEIGAGDIIYLTIDKMRKVYMKTICCRYELPYKPLAKYQDILTSFVLLTRNYLINFNHVTDINNDYFILTDGEKVSLGFTPRTKKASRDKYLQFLDGRI